MKAEKNIITLNRLDADQVLLQFLFIASVSLCRVHRDFASECLIS